MSDSPDFSVLFKMLNNNSEDSDNTGGSNFDMPDMETLMKVSRIMGSINSKQNDASTNLLYALKPFLRDSKKDKVDECAKFIKISSVLNEMNKSGGDDK